MNRLLIDKVLNKEKHVININENQNILIERLLSRKYVFNISGNVNIYINTTDKKDVTYEINVNAGSVSFNNVSINPKSVDITCNLNHEKTKALINNSVISRNGLVNYKISINHNAKETTSDVYNNGVTKEDGSIHFDVTSFVPKKSNLSVVNQDSKIIALNKTNDNKINPVLLIDEFDSESRHAAFIGDFNLDKLFYLMSRGLTKKEARTLLLKGMLIGTLDICFEEKERLNKELKKW